MGYARGEDLPLGKPCLNDADQAVGAASMLIYLRSLFMDERCRGDWDRATLLALLEEIANDDELFPLGTGRIIWESEEEHE